MRCSIISILHKIIVNITTVSSDRMQEQIEETYKQIKEDVKLIVSEEIREISEDDNLKHLIKNE